MKFSIKDFFSKCDQIRRKHFSCSKRKNIVIGISDNRTGFIELTTDLSLERRKIIRFSSIKINPFRDMECLERLAK